MQTDIVSREEWLEARLELLAAEKELTRRSDALARRRRAMPRVRLDKDYRFASDAGSVSLAELFDGRSQLIIYHFMFGPGWPEGCKSCSFVADHFDGALLHLANRDTTLVAVSRAPMAELDAFRQRMGWKFRWVSSHGSEFNFDYHVSFTPQELARGAVSYNYTTGTFPSEEGPGLSVFARDETGAVFHTYSTYGRGIGSLIGAYNFLDLVPKGRDEDRLDFTMSWVRHHDRYEQGYFGETVRSGKDAANTAASCCSGARRESSVRTVRRDREDCLPRETGERASHD